MPDLKPERFVNEAPFGAMKTFTLRGIKDSPPYLHDGRLLTLEDTVELFNLVLGLKLTQQEKADLSAFMKVLRGTAPVVLAVLTDRRNGLAENSGSPPGPSDACLNAG